MEGHCEVAVLAIFDGLAGGALDEGMKAPAVEKKHNLPVLAKCALHAFLEIFADHSAKAGRGRRRCFHVDKVDGGHGKIANSFRESEHLVVVFAGVVPTFKGRGCRAQNYRDIKHSGAFNCNISAMISWCVILFE